MNNNQLNLISVGYAKRALVEGSREFLRMQSYATQLRSYTVVVLTKKTDNLPAKIKVGNLEIIGTNASTRAGMACKAVSIIRRVIRQSPFPVVVSAQDPFEASVVSRLAVWGTHADNHVQLHGDLFNPQSHTGTLLHSLRIRYGTYVVRHTKNIRVVSGRIKASLCSLGVSPEQIQVLPIQASLSDFLAVGAERVYDRARPVRFMYVGRFAPEKNLTLLVRAFAAVNAKHSTSQLCLVGDGPLQPSLEKLVKELGLTDSVSFSPWTNDVPGVMKGADVFCLPSNHEGWAMVLVEAAAAGLAVVTTDVGCAGEFIHNQEQGFVVPIDDTQSYATALEKYLTQPQLLSSHGQSGHAAATAFCLSTDEYVARLVDGLTS